MFLAENIQSIAYHLRYCGVKDTHASTGPTSRTSSTTLSHDRCPTFLDVTDPAERRLIPIRKLLSRWA